MPCIKSGRLLCIESGKITGKNRQLGNFIVTVISNTIKRNTQHVGLETGVSFLQARHELNVVDVVLPRLATDKSCGHSVQLYLHCFQYLEIRSHGLYDNSLKTTLCP